MWIPFMSGIVPSSRLESMWKLPNPCEPRPVVDGNANAPISRRISVVESARRYKTE